MSFGFTTEEVHIVGDYRSGTCVYDTHLVTTTIAPVYISCCGVEAALGGVLLLY
jgi:hypothetical protein